MRRPKTGWMLLLALAGCGNAASGKYEPAYFSIKGTIENKDAPVQTAQRHVAFVWWGWGTGAVAQDVAVQSTFPANYQIDVKRLPPPEVIRQAPANLVQQGVDANMRWAIGQLVVYADNNGNGQLDLVHSGTESSPDTILSAREDLTIFYLAAGKPAAASWQGVLPTAPGFSIVDVGAMSDPQPGKPPGGCGSFLDDGTHWREPYCDSTSNGSNQLVASDNITLTLRSDPFLQNFACAGYWGPGDYSDVDLLLIERHFQEESCQNNPSCGIHCWGATCPNDPVPAGVTVACDATNTAYLWKVCHSDPSLCNTNVCQFGHGEIQPGTTPPADWPCPPK